MSTAVATYDRLVARGCLCGSEHPADCTIHGPGDNRGLAAFYRAGMSKAFPCAAACAICGHDGLMYPDVELDRVEIDREGDGHRHRPTLICPSCSSATAERSLVAEVVGSGLHPLNERRVFA